MSRSYWMTLVACGCLCVAFINQHFRIADLESQLGVTGETHKSGVAVAHAADTAVTTEEVLGRLGAVERRVGALQRQLALGAAPADSVHGAIEPWGEEGADDEREPTDESINPELEAVLDGDELGPEEKRERLRDIIREEQQAAFKEHRNERWKRRQERQDADLRDFAERAEISDSQLEDMMSFINQGREQVRSLFDAAHAGDLDYREARDSARGLREQIDIQIKDVLDEEQYTAYIEYREEERAQRRR